jgi:hypothetical protein
MGATNKQQTLTNVLRTVEAKLTEAKGHLRDMEKKKAAPRTFRRHLNAFLAAAESVIMIMERQGKRYARQKGKEPTFTQWFVAKQDLFRTPEESNPKAGKNIGTDATWIFLRAARNQTIHIEPINPAHLARGDIATRFRLRAEGEPEPSSPPVVAPAQNDTPLWAFKPLTIMKTGSVIATLQPPPIDILTICKKHILTLEALIAECKSVLK